MHTETRRLRTAFLRLGLACGLAWGAVPALVAPAQASDPGNLDAAAESNPSRQLIVRFHRAVASDAGLRDAAISAVAASLGYDVSHLRTLATGGEVLRIDSAGAVAPLVAAFAARPDVHYAEHDLLLQPLAVPNDTRYNEQWHYAETTGGINVESAWDTTTGAGTVVAVIDTGYRPHVDLDSKILPGYDMIGDLSVANDGNGRDSDASDPGDWVAANECGAGSSASNSSWHGTHVAGTVAAESDNGQGVAGVAWAADIVPVRVLGKCGGYTSDIADGIIWAAGGSVSGAPANANPADVLNLSLGGQGSCPSTTQSAINTARSLGATVVVAAGNSNANAANYTPASCSGVVSVASTDRNGSRSYFSNYGSVVDLAAPGGDVTTGSANGILSTLNSGSQGPAADSYAFYQGTSMAAPHVAGVAALLYAADPSITPDAVESSLTGTARAFPGSCSQCGSGIVDAAAAVADVTGGGGGGGGGPVELTAGTPETGLSGSTGSETFFTLEVPAGATDLTFDISGGSGDADLYVRFGSAPTTGSYDCRPYLNGNTENCTFASPSAGTWHVMLRAYSTYSGVSLVADYATGGGGGGGACPAGHTEYSGSLGGTGSSAYEPDGSWYYSGGSGTHSGVLSGPGGTDFDLYVQKWTGSSWSSVGSSTSADSEEAISYSGSSGYYRWRIYSYSGSGSYTFCLDQP